MDERNSGRDRFGPWREGGRGEGPRGPRFDEGRYGRGGRGPRGLGERGPDRGEYDAGRASEGYGDAGESAYGQMSRGSSDEAGGGYGGANVGGWGQSGMTSQWGGGGYGRFNTGLDYGQDGGFGPRGYSEGDFGQHRRRESGGYDYDHHHPGDVRDRSYGFSEPVRERDHHDHSYNRWREAQLANHDRDYGRWRSEQQRRYDEDYGTWRNERHDAFTREFEGWRSSRPVSEGSTHGGNPTLGDIADGHAGRRPHHEAQKEAEKAEHGGLKDLPKDDPAPR